MKHLAIFFLTGTVAGTFLSPLHPIMTLATIGVILMVSACFVRKETIRIWLLLALFGIAGAVRSSYEMQKMADRFHTQKRSAIFYHYHVLSREKSSVFHSFRQKCSILLDSFRLSAGNQTIVKAMTIGEKAALSQDTRLLYSRTGASHVLALSGMHLAIIYAILAFIMLKLALWLYHIPDLLFLKYGPKPKLKYILTHRIRESALHHLVIGVIIILIWGYVLMVGMTPSIVRSGLMLTIYGLAGMLFRQKSTLNVLSFTAFVMVLISPLSLFDVGFQMSFLAVFGIAVYYSPFHKFAMKWQKIVIKDKEYWNWRFYKTIPIKAINFALDCIALSLSAQIMVAPLVVYYFGVLSLSSLITTVVVSVTAMLIVWISFFLLFTALAVSLSSAIWLSPALDAVATIQRSVLEWQASLPCSYIDGASISFPQLSLIYLFILFVTLAVKRWLRIKKLNYRN